MGITTDYDNQAVAREYIKGRIESFKKEQGMRDCDTWDYYGSEYNEPVIGCRNDKMGREWAISYNENKLDPGYHIYVRDFFVSGSSNRQETYKIGKWDLETWCLSTDNRKYK